MKDMRGVILIIVVFLFFAFIGYQIAFNSDGSSILEAFFTSTPAENESPENQLRAIVIHVNRMDQDQPKMVSAWFFSVLFAEGTPPTVTIAQIYPIPGNPERHQSLERSFSVTREGNPSPIFWRAIKTQNIEWEGYLMIDDFTVQTLMSWLNGAGDFSGLLGATQNSPRESYNILINTCQSLGQLSKRDPMPFGMNDFVPAHFRSDLSMEKALSYWDAVTKSTIPIKCDVVLAP